MKIVIIGTGNVAWHLIKRIRETAHQIVQLVNLHSGEVAKEFGIFNLPVAFSTAEMNKAADIYLIAVSDNAIANLHLPFLNNKQIVIHTSGIADIDLLKYYGNNYGCIYPLQTFTKGNAVDFSRVPLIIESSNMMTKETTMIFAESLSLHLNYLPLHKRRILHLAAVLVNNFSNHLFAKAKDLLDKEEISFDLMKPMLAETVDKLNRLSPAEAQTGPAKRNDITTLDVHRHLLVDDEQLLQIYELLTASILQQYKKEE